MKHLSARLSLVLLAIAAISSCSTFDDFYTMGALASTRKAAALADQGVEAFNNKLIAISDYTQVDNVKRYFVVALRYDPENPKASQYLSKVEAWRDATVQAKLKVVSGLAAKKTRKPDEDYTMLVALKIAVFLDPADADVRKYQNDTASVKSTFIQTLLGNCKAATAKLKDKDKNPGTDVEGLNISMLKDSNRVLAVEPGNLEAKGYMSTSRRNLAKTIGGYNAAIKKAIDAESFDAANAELAKIAALNQKVNGAFAQELASATYEVNFNWARALQKKKDYANARIKIDLALAARRTDEALAVKAGIASRNSESSTVMSFDLSLADVDRQIGAGDYVSAARQIESLARTNKEQAKVDQLDARRQKINQALADLYDKGVAAYRAENFKLAIQYFQTIVNVNVDYEQASDYLDKATAKQKLLDQFSSGS